MFKVKGHRSMSQHNVTYQQQAKHYKMAMDRLSDFKFGISVVIKADKDWRGVGRPSSCNAFAIATFSRFRQFHCCFVLWSFYMNKDVCKLYALYKSRFSLVNT